MELTETQIHDNQGYSFEHCQPDKDEKEMDYERSSTTTNRKPILKRSLRPCLFLLKLFGLYYDCGDRKIGFLYRCSRLYVGIVNLIIFANFVYVVSSEY